MTLLEAERRRRGWNQTELAFYSRTTQGEISRFERRQAIPSPTYAKRIGRALGVSPDALLHEAFAPGGVGA